MLYGLNGLKGLDPKRRTSADQSLVGIAGFRLEGLTAPAGYWFIPELEVWTGPGYTGTKITGTPYATSTESGNPASRAFDADPSTPWGSASSPGTGVRIGVVSQELAPPPSSAVGSSGTSSSLAVFRTRRPRSLRIMGWSAPDYWLAAFRLDVLTATLTKEAITYVWEPVAEFSGIAFPGHQAWWGTDL